MVFGRLLLVAGEVADTQGAQAKQILKSQVRKSFIVAGRATFCGSRKVTGVPGI